MLDNIITGSFESAQKQSVIRNERYVVLFDDQFTGRTILEKVITQIADNINVVSFSKPVLAMVWLDSNRADVIVTDYMMPFMNGIDVIHVLLKPGRLTHKERETMRQHTEIGNKILSSSESKYMKMGAVIALNHHEHFNGQGYPKGLKGSDIPLIAKIVAVADVFDALVSPRPYKSSWTTESALDYIKQQSGKQLDPECVQAFFERIDDVRKIQVQYADTE